MIATTTIYRVSVNCFNWDAEEKVLSIMAGNLISNSLKNHIESDQYREIIEVVGNTRTLFFNIDSGGGSRPLKYKLCKDKYGNKVDKRKIPARLRNIEVHVS